MKENLKLSLKENLNSKERKKMQRGITLVALVVTIVVLLILAGITIVTLTGENGIIKTAQDSKTQSDRASIKEQIERAVINSRLSILSDANMDLSELEVDLKKIDGLNIESKGEDGSLPWVVTVNEYKFKINENGTVEVVVEGITLSKTTLKLVAGESETITAILTEGTTGTITWESSDSSKVTVNNGVVTAVGSTGTATIKAKVEGASFDPASCTVTIVQKVASIAAEPLTVGKGKTGQIVVKTTPESNVEDVTYSFNVSSGANYATVNETTGVVTGVAEGSAEVLITGTTKGGETKTATCAITVETVIEGTLDEAGLSWSDLKTASTQISAMGTVTTSPEVEINGTKVTIRIGDTKSITIKNSSGTNETYLAEIIGFKHDEKTDGTKAGISFQLKDCMQSTAKMNSTETNAGGWKESAMRAYLNTRTSEEDTSYHVYDNIETDLKDKIVEVKKYTGLYGNKTSDETTDKLWLLSELEVFGTRKYSVNVAEGTQYAYYADTNNSKKKYLNGTAKYWWLRSPHYNYDNYFCYVYSNGSVGYSYAGYSNWVALGFAI